MQFASQSKQTKHFLSSQLSSDILSVLLPLQAAQRYRRRRLLPRALRRHWRPTCAAAAGAMSAQLGAQHFDRHPEARVFLARARHGPKVNPDFPSNVHVFCVAGGTHRYAPKRRSPSLISSGASSRTRPPCAITFQSCPS